MDGVIDLTTLDNHDDDIENNSAAPPATKSSENDTEVYRSLHLFLSRSLSLSEEDELSVTKRSENHDEENEEPECDGDTSRHFIFSGPSDADLDTNEEEMSAHTHAHRASVSTLEMDDDSMVTLPASVRLAAQSSAERKAKEAAQRKRKMEGEGGEDPNETSSALPERLYIKQRVEVLYQKQWYPGTIVHYKDNLRTPYKIQCDADKEGVLTSAKGSDIRALPLAVGSKVWREEDQDWIECVVENAVRDGAGKIIAYDVKETESGRTVSNANSQRVRSYVKPIEMCARSTSDLPKMFYKKMRLEIEYQGTWYPGTWATSKRYESNNIGVQCDADKEGVYTWGSAKVCRVIPLEKGSTVWAEQDGEWYEGTITDVKTTTGDDGKELRTYSVFSKSARKNFVNWEEERVRSVKPEPKKTSYGGGYGWKREAVPKPLVKLETLDDWPTVYKAVFASGGPAKLPVKVLVETVNRWNEADVTKLPLSKAIPVQVLDPATAVGAKVGCLWNRVDRSVYMATITGVSRSGKYSVTYADGDKKEGVSPLWITYEQLATKYTGPPIDAKALLASAVPGKSQVLFRQRDYPKDKWVAGTFKGVSQGVQVGKFGVDKSLNSIVTLWRGDITKLGVDAIQNAANSGLYSGGGICGAIHDAAGYELEDACMKFPEVAAADAGDDEEEDANDGGGWGWSTFSYSKKKRPARCPTGETRVTPGFKLHAKNVLHTVGPTSFDKDALVKAYISSLEASKKNGFASIALCCVSTGIYGFPPEVACPLALSTVRKWLEANRGTHKLKKIIFCVFTKDDDTLYKTYMPQVFPCE